MTPEERVRKLMGDCPVLIDVAETRDAISEAIRSAVAEEREACAKVVELGLGKTITSIANAIRARSVKTEAHHCQKCGEHWDWYSQSSECPHERTA